MTEETLFDICPDTYKYIVIYNIPIHVTKIIVDYRFHDVLYLCRIINQICQSNNFDEDKFKNILCDMTRSVNDYYRKHWFTIGKRDKLLAISLIEEQYYRNKQINRLMSDIFETSLSLKPNQIFSYIEK